MDHYYDKMAKEIEDSVSIRTIYDLESYTELHEPFMKEAKVVPLMKTILESVLKSLEKTYEDISTYVNYLTKFYVIGTPHMPDARYQVFFVVGEGKNGNGNFVKDDMTSVLNLLNKLDDDFLDVACLEMQADRLDDVSDWLITFRL